jgi:hypothetical protein
LTPKSGGKVDYELSTQVGRAMKELGVQMIPSYCPQARGRSERNFSTWQGRLPQELRLRRIRTLEAANEFLNKTSGRPVVPADLSRSTLHSFGDYLLGRIDIYTLRRGDSLLQWRYA